MSRGTGRATSQNSGIDWKDKLRELQYRPDYSIGRRLPFAALGFAGRTNASVPTRSLSGALGLDTSLPSANLSRLRLFGVDRAGGMRDGTSRPTSRLPTTDRCCVRRPA